MNFEQKVADFIERYHLLDADDRVCVGLSGGADSVSLLLVLHALGYSVCAVHVNHNLRGRASEEDEGFVRTLCERLRIPLFVYSYAVAEIARERKIGTEEAGRLARQAAYADCIAKGRADKIALAHHANDLAETFLFRVARGSSLHGMAGIRPVQVLGADTALRENTENILSEGVYDSNADGGLAETRRYRFTVVRPLLGVMREETENYLRGKGQTWRTDETNLTESCVRNSIRMHVIPYLEQNVNPRTVTHIAYAAEDMANADDFLAEEAKHRADRLTITTVASVMIGNDFVKEPAIMQNYILMEILGRMTGSTKDVGREHIRQLKNLFHRRSGSQVDLPYQLLGVRDYDGITIMYRAGGERRKAQEEIPVSVPGTADFGMWRFHCTFEDPAGFDPDKIKGIRYTKWFDYDKIKNALVFRRRIQRDRIVVRADGASRKLKDYLIDEKIPERERDDIPLLASGNRIFWVVGHRTSEDSKVTDQTRRILKIQAERKQ